MNTFDPESSVRPGVGTSDANKTSDSKSSPDVDDAWILQARPAKHSVDPYRPYAWLVEEELSRHGRVDPVATLFLTNRECPFRCLFCDLWKHTTDETVPLGAIPAQISWALDRLPPARHIKLYNSGNFFDARAIPPGDHPAIAGLVAPFDTVIVENHPRLCNERVLRFRDAVSGQLEVAMGLETVHPDVLPRLNKQMTLDDYARAAEFLKREGVRLRTFIIVQPPLVDASAAVPWAIRSLEFAFEQGIDVAALIPARGGNGALEHLQAQGLFSPPRLAALEAAAEAGVRLNRGTVLVDLWDLERLADCPKCFDARRQRLEILNRTQTIPPAVACECRDAPAQARQLNPRPGDDPDKQLQEGRQRGLDHPPDEGRR